MNKQKRMVYIYEENVEFYESLPNKSEYINRMLRESRLDKAKVESHDSLDFVRQRVAEMDARNRKARG